jgi:hypothetical protein
LVRLENEYPTPTIITYLRRCAGFKSAPVLCSRNEKPFRGVLWITGLVLLIVLHVGGMQLNRGASNLGLAALKGPDC